MNNNLLIKILLLVTLLSCSYIAKSRQREKQNFNSNWLLKVGEEDNMYAFEYDDSNWQKVTLPRAFNEAEAYAKDIVDLTDTICWYRKHFTLTENDVRGKVFIEFEGARQGADIWLNGHKVGFSDNGVMAFGFDLTPFAQVGENVVAVRCDNSWNYRSREHDSRYQWNDKNFNANYGGLPKNVYLHLTDKLYQTLPLYSNLGTTGTYIYATDFQASKGTPNKAATIHAESQVRNEDSKAHSFIMQMRMFDLEGKKVLEAKSNSVTLQPGNMTKVSISKKADNLHLWSWGYGYLYTVETSIVEDDEECDFVATRTGFRKTEFKEGKFYLNDRVMMIHGYAQRTSNEWPGVGLGVPAWLSDYSNHLMVESGGNLVRWMHVTPWKQDVESCDRVGLMQAMPAGDAEKDVTGPRWEQRVELMRDAIIYNRNNPSIIFYEGGNESISREHMLQLKAIRDEYDPHGGRAIGSREMLDIDEAEYGGEMLYINKSAKHPMWAMEYCRDEGLRKYWDEYSYPYHKEGEGPLYRGKPALEYNHNMDAFAVEMVRRWHEYWLERPGTGRRVSSGGVKIVFSDTNTHHRGESNFRMSGVTDAMRIPKDAFYAHQVMWDGWVEPEKPHTYIVGHWNYEPNTRKPVYVVSNEDMVELFLNGKSIGTGKQSYKYLFTFEDVPFEAGCLEAIGYSKIESGSQESADMVPTSLYKLETAGKPFKLRITPILNPEGMKADGADMALFQVEVVDSIGRRCPLDNRMVHFSMSGEGQWIGGLASRNNKDFQMLDEKRDPSLLDAAATKNVSDNFVRAYSLPVECGVNRVLVRSTVNAGSISLSVMADGVRPDYITINTIQDTGKLPAFSLAPHLERGETPMSPSYYDIFKTVPIKNVIAGSNEETESNSYDDNELSEWQSDGRLENAWATYRLERKAIVSEIVLKLAGWRTKHYPLEVYSGKKLLWKGFTQPSLGYVHLPIEKQESTDNITIKMYSPATDKQEVGDTKELAGGVAGELDRIGSTKGSVKLRIVEIDFLEKQRK